MRFKEFIQQDEMSLRQAGQLALNVGADMAFGPETGINGQQAIQAAKTVVPMAASAINTGMNWAKNLPYRRTKQLPNRITR